VVEDASGAVVPAAQIAVKNVDTNFGRELTTGTDGRFVFLQLAPGRYQVTVSKEGFATLVQEGVVVSVGQTVTLSPSLKVSDVAETVTVTGTATVDTTRTESSSTLNETTIATTPILGRKFEDLLTLTPGVSVVQGPDGDEITFAGQRGVFNNISLDGGDYNNGFFGEQMGGQRAAIDITLEAVKEFQVVATGAGAEFGRTAGGVVNVITKSGTNDLHGSLFHFQRLEGLTSEASDGSKLEDFHREQFGGTLGGPIQKDKAFFFLAVEHINENFVRPNLSTALGSCPVGSPNIREHEDLIADNAECQRLALLDFFQTTRGQDEGQPIDHKINNTAVLAKVDWLLNPSNTLAVSYNFDYSKNINQTFDVAGYGTSANGTEGPSKINVLNLNLFSTVSPTKLNELHITYSREERPRSAVESNVPADTAMGFVNTFRFGNPFFLQPAVDELIWRGQIKNNFSIVTGSHTIKVGGEWIHTVNEQVFRGFFTGRYIFDSVPGFLRYASPAGAGGFGPYTLGCSDGTFVTFPATCAGGATTTGGPLLLYLQGAGLQGLATDATGASDITNNEIALFVQDKWQPTPNLTLNLGLRWDAQYMPETIDPRTTAYAFALGDPSFPSDGDIPDQGFQLQPRFGFAWDVKGDARSVLRGSAGIYYARQNMLSQVGSVTTNGVQQQTIFRQSFPFATFADMPVWPNVLTPAPVAPGEFPLFSGVRVFDRDYENPRTYTVNLAYEQELAADWAAYIDLTAAWGRNLTRFLNYNVANPVCCDAGAGTGNKYAYLGSPFGPQLGEVMVATSLGESFYRGATIGVRKRFSRGYQIEANYVLSKDEDDDSNERDPFTDRSFNFFDHELDYGLSDRDIRHKFNFYGYGEFWGFRGNARIQARSAQPITPNPRSLNGVDRGRNTLRKDNAFFSFDWRLMRPFRVGKDAELIPMIEMFNTFNNENNINTVSTPALFNFDGFLRLGIGDPRQLQLAIKLVF
jgi:outer membrane receptor protein involved in Fe transport